MCLWHITMCLWHITMCLWHITICLWHITSIVLVKQPIGVFVLQGKDKSTIYNRFKINMGRKMLYGT